MRRDLPRYTRTPLGETPDGYLVDGESLTPISRIDEVAGARARSYALARIDALAATIARVDAIDAQIAKTMMLAQPPVFEAFDQDAQCIEEGNRAVAAAQARSAKMREWLNRESIGWMDKSSG